jgi:uncharacterized protein YkwD
MKQAIWSLWTLFFVGCASTPSTPSSHAVWGPVAPALSTRLSPLLVPAAAAARRGGLRAAQEALGAAGYFPFALAVVDARDPTELLAKGMTHCARVGTGEALCARLTARVIDRSPIHLRVVALPGHRLGRVHLSMPGGLVTRRRIDRAGIVDLPVFEGSAARVGVTTFGRFGAETGLLLTVGRGLPPAGNCTAAESPSALVAALNRQRRTAGLRPLTRTAAPSGYARLRALGLSRRFGHPSGGLGATLRDLGLGLDRAAEVVGEDPSLTAVCRSWMRSPAHRHALMAPHRDRIALVRSGDRIAALMWRGR